VFYFSKKYKLEEVVIIKHPKDDGKTFYHWRQFLSDDGRYLYIHELLKIVDLDTLESIVMDREKDFIVKSSDSNYRNILYDAKFTPHNKYIIEKFHLKGILMGEESDFKSETRINIKNNKNYSTGARYETFFDNNDKFKVVFDTIKYEDLHVDISLHVDNEFEPIYVFEKNYKKLLTYDAAWHKNRVFIHYSYKDNSNKNHWDNGGIFDVTTSKMICKDSFKINSNMRDIGWIDDANLYILSDTRINYFTISDEECIYVGHDSYGIKKFNKVNKVHLQDGVLTVYPDRKSGNIEIKEIKLKKITEDTIYIYKSFNKINKLLKADFEKRALKTIDKLVNTQSYNLELYPVGNIISKKNEPAYISYFVVRYIQKHKDFDEDLYRAFKIYIGHAYWNGYYKQAKEMTAYIKSLKISQKKFKDLINLSEAMYLICIGKDEGYDMLFDMQPISKKLKNYIRIITSYETPFNKNINKLIAALDMKKSEFGESTELEAQNKTTIFFDLNGNKITNGKNIETKVTPKANEKSNAIKLLD
jgi:hypothetical protein